MIKFALALLMPILPLLAQSTAAAPTDQWKALDFLTGTWEAKVDGKSGVTVAGTYSFQRELAGHVLARHSTQSNCSGPDTFDCQHGDLLYLFEDAPGQPLKAIYLDNEGHVIHYDVSTPNPTTALFLSEQSRPGPQFRLVYELKDSVMNGKFQMRMPGTPEWKSYLEWSGSKKPK